MKMQLKNKKANRGIAMTEYLIILGIVAIAAIAVVGLFGNQIKDVFYRTTSTLGGTDASGGKSAAITNSSSGADTGSSMKNFDSGQNGSQ
jgi:Flp pilus assembly pilin Flp